MGEELTVAYVDYLNLSEDRKRMLKQQYYFDCTCDHCTNKTTDDLKMAGAVVDGVKVDFHTFLIDWFIDWFDQFISQHFHIFILV